MTSGWSASL